MEVAIWLMLMPIYLVLMGNQLDIKLYRNRITMLSMLSFFSALVYGMMVIVHG